MFKNSEVLFKEAVNHLVGGVNSPVRSFKYVGGTPIFIRKAKGAYLWDVDGNRFIDYCQGFGTTILGHSDPDVTEAIKQAVSFGQSFGATTEREVILSGLIKEALPSIEIIRFTNSGTEAVLGAIRLARGCTKRTKLIKFINNYHGHVDSLLTESEGIPKELLKETLLAPFNDFKKINSIVKAKARDIAAIILEPVGANSGLLIPEEGFLKDLRRLCDNYGIILIFDEVITGFRLSFGGAQGFYNIRPDLTCLGKIIGGGLPVGAFGGSKDIMRFLAPIGKVYQAGTFSGNPLTMAAGIAVLKKIKKMNIYEKLENLGRILEKGIMSCALDTKVSLNFKRAGSIFSLNKRLLFKRFFWRMIERGIYLSPSPSECNFISLSHSRSDIEKTVSSYKKAVRDLS